jgi:hypothetical protein
MKISPGGSSSKFGLPWVKGVFSRSQKPAQRRSPLPPIPIIIPLYEPTILPPHLNNTPVSNTETSSTSAEFDVFAAQLEACKRQMWWISKPDAPQTTLPEKVGCFEFSAVITAPRPSLSIRELREKTEAERLRRRFARELEPPCGLTLSEGIRGTWEDLEEFLE